MKHITLIIIGLMVAVTPALAQNTGASRSSQGTGNSPVVGLPYCESAPVGEHYERAVEYIRENYPAFFVVRDSGRQTGPCNNGNTAWTMFDVAGKKVDGTNQKMGEVTINGDTLSVTFSRVGDATINQPQEPRLETQQRERIELHESGYEDEDRYEDGDEYRIQERNSEEIKTRQEVGESINNVGQSVRSAVEGVLEKTGLKAYQAPGMQVAEDAPEFVKEKLEAYQSRVLEARTSVQEKYNTWKEDVTEQAITVKEQIKERLSEDRQVIAENVLDKIYDTKTRVLNNYLSAVERIDANLTAISTRTDKAELAGLEVGQVRTAIDLAYGTLDAARNAIQEQLQAVYAFQIEGDETVAEAMRAVRDQLQEDLGMVRESVQKALDATRLAAQALAEIPGVNEVSVTVEDGSEVGTPEQNIEQ